MDKKETDTHLEKWKSAENARRALELLISRPKAGVFFMMETLTSGRSEEARKDLERVYTYALNLAVELLRREEKAQAGRISDHAEKFGS